MGKQNFQKVISMFVDIKDIIDKHHKQEPITKEEYREVLQFLTDVFKENYKD